MKIRLLSILFVLTLILTACGKSNVTSSDATPDKGNEYKKLADELKKSKRKENINDYKVKDGSTTYEIKNADSGYALVKNEGNKEEDILNFIIVEDIAEVEEGTIRKIH